MPREQRQRIEQMDELYGFLAQSNISQKNIARLKTLCAAPDDEVRKAAQLIREIACVHPHKRRRWKMLARNHRNLFLKLKAFLGEAVWEDNAFVDLGAEPCADEEEPAAEEPATDEPYLHYLFEENPSHEPASALGRISSSSSSSVGRISITRTTTRTRTSPDRQNARFMVPMRAQKVVEAFHEDRPK